MAKDAVRDVDKGAVKDVDKDAAKEWEPTTRVAKAQVCCHRR